MIVPDSLTLIEETDDHWLFSFVPAAEEGDDNNSFLEYVDATLKISKDGPYVEYIKLENSKPFRPRFGVKVREFLVLIRFGPGLDGGPIVPRNEEWEKFITMNLFYTFSRIRE